jgi:hypothetical protein
MHAAAGRSRASKNRGKSPSAFVASLSFLQCVQVANVGVTSLWKSSCELPQPSSDREPQVIGALLLQPYVTRVIVSEFHNQHALVLG